MLPEKIRLEEYAAEVNEALKTYLPPAENSVVCQAMHYSILNGGKRIRPVLTLEFCRVCGGSVKSALPLACAVEMIHTYSLIHDDLPCMDDDILRRGKPSCHVKFGEANALLAGDALLTLAFELIFKASLPAQTLCRAGAALSAAAGWNGMIGGQVMDLDNEGKIVGLETLEQTDNKKTGCLIEVAALLGCLAAGASEEKQKKALAFASRIGLAFQIVDDIMDLTGDTESLGKPAGSDAENQKATYPGLMGIDAAAQKVKELTDEAKAALECFGSENSFLLFLADTLAGRDR